MFNIYMNEHCLVLVLLHGGFGGIEYGSLAQLVKFSIKRNFSSKKELLAKFGI